MATLPSRVHITSHEFNGYNQLPLKYLSKVLFLGTHLSNQSQNAFQTLLTEKTKTKQKVTVILNQKESAVNRQQRSVNLAWLVLEQKVM